MQRAKKSFGQNWLVDETAVQKLIDAARIQEGERVVEIGPGTGIITQALIDAGARVTAFELDHDLIEPLKERFGDRIDLVEGDVLRSFDSTSFQTYKVVSSIPYNITSDILKTFLTVSNPPSVLCLVVQKEVAERVTAKPPDMSLLSVVCQVYARCEYIATIKAGAFRPIPKVDSAILRLTLHPQSDAEDVIQIAKVGFSSKRKQLKNNLAAISIQDMGGHKARPYDEKTDWGKVLEHIGLSPTVRAENLTVDDWVKLAAEIRKV